VPAAHPPQGAMVLAGLALAGGLWATAVGRLLLRGFSVVGPGSGDDPRRRSAARAVYPRRRRGRDRRAGPGAQDPPHRSPYPTGTPVTVSAIHPVFFAAVCG
jgi:hypothetical protein